MQMVAVLLLLSAVTDSFLCFFMILFLGSTEISLTGVSMRLKYILRCEPMETGKNTLRFGV